MTAKAETEPRRFRYQVPAEHAGQRLDRVVSAQSFLPTRSRVQTLVRAGLVKVDGVVRKASFIVCAGSWIEVEVPLEPDPSKVEPEDIALDVLYEDEAMIAVNKPAGMASHPAPGSRQGTLVAALLHRWSFGGEWPDPSRPGIVHRLDKDTTGVILVAKTPHAMHALARQFAARTVRKRYVAVVRGWPRAESGTIDLPIGRDPFDRKRMQAKEGQLRPALTRYEVVERLGDGEIRAALLQAAPETGRTHQIRVHFASLGHPIWADPLYGGSSQALEKSFALRDEVGQTMQRHALHAKSLDVRHPLGGEWLHIEAPLPDDMCTLIEQLRALAAVSS